MSEASLRLQSYARVASMPLAAVVGTSAAADITYVEVGEFLPPSGPVAFALGGDASFVIGGADASATGIAINGFFVGNTSYAYGVQFAGGYTSSGFIPTASRFAAGDLIQFGAGNTAGIGALAKVKSGKTVKSKGDFAASEGPQSGFVGFGFGDDPDGLNYGWISLTWDGSALFLDGYAWENEAGVGITAGTIPAPGALGLLGLAAGAAGLRRQRKC